MDGGLTSLLTTDIVGRVASVSGSQMVVLVSDRGRFNSDDLNSGLHAGQIVKIPVADNWVFGLVTAMTEPAASSSGGDVQVFAELDLLGEAPRTSDGRFARGVTLVPAVGAPVCLSATDDIATVYANAGRCTVRIGSVHHDHAIAATVAPDDLLGKHFAVLGGTGTGKSCATALILQRILKQNPNAHIVLLDPHCEYAPAFAGMAEVVDSTTLELPYWLFSLEELAAVVLRTDRPMTESPAEINILTSLVVAAKRSYQAQNPHLQHEGRRPITVDTPVPYRMTDVLKLLEEEMGRLDKSEALTPFLRLKSRLQALRDDVRYSFMFSGIALRDNLSSLLSRLFRVPVNGKPITILDLSALPSDILSVIVSVLGRITFEFALFSGQSIPILLVCEEAHRYLPEQPNAGFEPARRNLAQIAKEGRKYGVSLCLVSQRPADLAAGALSQCSTVFAMRLTSQTDQAFVRGALPDWSAGLMDLLPSLRNGEAVAVGEGVSVPMRLVFDTLPPESRPKSATAAFSERWQSDDITPEFIGAIVHRWRDAR